MANFTSLTAMSEKQIVVWQSMLESIDLYSQCYSDVGHVVTMNINVVILYGSVEV